jgi:hypothetical protein
MGEIEFNELLKTTLESINKNIAFQQEMIIKLQEENKELREQLNSFIFNKNNFSNTNNYQYSNENKNINFFEEKYNHSNSRLQKEFNINNENTRNYDPLKAEVITKFKRNKKLILKNKILETIKSHILSIPELKDIIVDQYRYCSKASFYRYIEELKQHDFIHISNNTIKIKPLVEVV